MINLFKLQLERVHVEEKYKKETIPLIKYKWWATLKAIDNLMKEVSK